MSRLAIAAVLLSCGLVLSACNSKGPDEAVLTPAVPAAPPQPPAVSGVIAGALGQKLDDADRRKAFDASLAALDGGKRQTWKGGHGSYGFVEAGAESPRAEGLCRSYSHKVYLAGRPQAGEGLACKSANGAWKIVS